MRRSWLTAFLSCALVGLMAFALTERIQAQGGSAPGCCVAVIDVIRIREEYQRYKDLVEEQSVNVNRLTDEDESRKQKIDQLEAEINSLGVGDPTLAERTRSWMQMQIDRKSWGEFAQLALAREFGLWSAEVYKEIYATAQETARRNGYHIVLYREKFEPISIEPQALETQVRIHKLIYADDSVDITQTVLDKLNEEYKAKPRQQMMQLPF